MAESSSNQTPASHPVAVPAAQQPSGSVDHTHTMTGTIPSPEATSANMSMAPSAEAGGQQHLQAPAQGPPTRKSIDLGEDASSPVHYMRDPHKLIAYLVPFPKPDFRKGLFHAGDPKDIPERFLIYTPPPPPLSPPKEGEKEGKTQKLQRKWQEELRSAKTSNAKVTSWKGVKSRATKGIGAAMNWTTSSSLDFLNRVPNASGKAEEDKHGDDGVDEGDTTRRTLGLQEMVLVYPESLPGTQEEIRQEFVGSMLRTKSQAQKDAILATGLMPVGLAIDVLATVVWPFGGLAEIDGVWAYSSIRGAKTARTVTKRLHSSTPDQASSAVSDDTHNLRLTFTPSPRLEVLRRYLVAECHTQNSKYFKSEGPAPTETEVLHAIGWSPSDAGGETKNWEDEAWETEETKSDLRNVFHKAAKEWMKWIAAFEKDPEKALKK